VPLLEWDLLFNSKAQFTVVTTKKDSEEKKVKYTKEIN
jgi:hypothetical protein